MMNPKKLNKNLCKLGPVTNMAKGVGQTGYQLTMLHLNDTVTYDCSQEVFDYLDQGRHNCYPNVMELIYAPICNENGTIIQLLQVDSYENEEGCLIHTNLTIATAKAGHPMAEKPVTVGEFFQIDGDAIRFAPDFWEKESKMAHLTYSGSVPKPENGMELKIVPDISIYTWDWTKPKAPPAITGISEEDYVPGFTLGSLEDVERCCWVWFGSLRGDDSKLDTVCFFVGQLEKE